MLLADPLLERVVLVEARRQTALHGTCTRGGEEFRGPPLDATPAFQRPHAAHEFGLEASHFERCVHGTPV